MMPRRHRLAVVVAMLAAIVAGCGAGDPAMTPAGSAPGASPPTGATAPVTASHAVPSGPSATDRSSFGVPGRDVPPDALLSAEGGDPAPGQLGSYAWLDTGSDAPWLPGAPIAVGAGEPLTVRFEPDGEIASWRARYVPAGQADPLGARSLGEGTGIPAFAAPEPGAWTAEVSVDFGPAVGSASWFWRLEVR